MFESNFRRAQRWVVCAIVSVVSAGCQEQSTGVATGRQATRAGSGDSTAKPTLVQYLNIRAPLSVEAAPDGTIYFIDRPDGIYQLYRRPPGAGQTPERLTHFTDGIDSFSLAPDGRHLIAIASVGGNEQGQLHLLDTAGRELKPILHDPNVKHGAILWRDDCRAFAYQANDANPTDFHVHIYDLGTGQTRRIFDRPGHNVPSAFTIDGKRLAITTVHSNYYSQIFETDTATGEIREVTPSDQQRRFRVVGYEEDPRSLIVVTDYLGDRDNLARLNTNDRSVSRILPELASHEIDSAALSLNRKYLAAVANQDGYGILHGRRLSDMKPIPFSGIPTGVVNNLWFQGPNIYFSVQSPQNPGTTFKARVDDLSRPIERVATPFTAGVNVGECIMPKLVRIKSFDGLEIPAFIYLPKGYKQGTPIPFILSIHGGPEAQYRPQLTSWQQYLLREGYGVLAPNVRGSTGYGTTYQNMDNYKKRMDSVKDALACANWLIDQKYTAEKKIAVVGGSYGGFMVMACITEQPEIWGAACNIVGIVNYETFLANTMDYRRALREAEYGPLTDAAFLRSISPIHKVDKITAPLLVVHGKNDPRVPLGEAEQIVRALQARKQPVELQVFDDEGHGIRKLNNRVKYEEKLVAFCRAHLKG